MQFFMHHKNVLEYLNRSQNIVTLNLNFERLTFVLRLLKLLNKHDYLAIECSDEINAKHYWLYKVIEH